MKSSTLFMVLTMAAALVFSATGCKHRPVDTTNIPGKTRVGIGNETGGDTSKSGLDIANTLPKVSETTDIKPIEMNNNPPNTPEGIGAGDEKSLINKLLDDPNHKEDRNIFAPYTIYFDTDSSVIKSDEGAKLQSVADYYHSHPQHGLVVEGYCDERGTEGYNLALGDRRANAIREYLVKLGVQSGSIKAVSFGEANPVDPAHNEAAWKKNRRGVSVLITPGETK